VETARAGVEQVVDSVREHVGPVAEQVKERASAVAQQQMTSAADGLEKAAGLVTTLSAQLRQNNLRDLSHYTDLTADEMQKAAAWLRTTTPEEIARNVEDLAKKQPELFVAGAGAARRASPAWREPGARRDEGCEEVAARQRRASSAPTARDGWGRCGCRDGRWQRDVSTARAGR
jgi:hypothetical protein